MIKNLIKGYYLWAKYHLNKSYRDTRKLESDSRLLICENCKYFWKFGRNCMICGCFIDVKCRSEFDLDENGKSVDGCPEKYW